MRKAPSSPARRPLQDGEEYLRIPPAVALEGLSARVAQVVGTGHRFGYDMVHDPRNCGCGACLRSDALLAELRQPATRAAVEWLIARGHALAVQLMYLYELRCAPPDRLRSASAEVSVLTCHALTDAIGTPLATIVRRMTGRLWADRHGTCPRCAGEPL